MKFQVKEIGLFHRMTGVMFQSDFCAVPWGVGGDGLPNTVFLIVTVL